MKHAKKYFYEKIQKVTVTELSIIPLIFMIADTTAFLLQKPNREITQTALIISMICFLLVLFLKNRIGVTPYDEAQDELRRLVRKKGTLVKRMSFNDSFRDCKCPKGYKKNLGAVTIKNLWGKITSVYVIFEDHEGNIKYYDFPQKISEKGKPSLRRGTYKIKIVDIIETISVFLLVCMVLSKSNLTADDWQPWVILCLLIIHSIYKYVSGMIEGRRITESEKNTGSDMDKNKNVFVVGTAGSGRSINYYAECSVDKRCKPCSCDGHELPKIFHFKNRSSEDVVAVCCKCGKHTNIKGDMLTKVIDNWNNDVVEKDGIYV